MSPNIWDKVDWGEPPHPIPILELPDTAEKAWQQVYVAGKLHELSPDFQYMLRYFFMGGIWELYILKPQRWLAESFYCPLNK